MLINPSRADFSARTTIGNLLIISNSFLYAIYIVISKDLFQRYGALNVITWIFLVGALVTIPVGFYSLQQEKVAALSTVVWVTIAFI